MAKPIDVSCADGAVKKPLVLVVGDVMLDEFVYGETRRISPEAATPVLSVSRIARMVGGAGNVARGIAALDVNCELLGVVGEDVTGNDLMRELAGWNTPRLIPWVLMDGQRPTTRKTRFVSESHSSHLLRVDTEKVLPISINMERDLVVRALACLTDADVLVLSDYCKGVITSNVALELIRAARKAGKIVIVDSKRDDLSIFAGANIVKLNEGEFDRAVAPFEDIAGASQLAARMGFDHILLTRGERGLTLYSADGTDIKVHGRAVRVKDVSGAGDTVVATLAAMLAGGCDLIPSLRRANHAASIAVGKPGTATVTRAELANDKIGLYSDCRLLTQRIAEWENSRVVFTNGCFDLLHTGHIHLLTQARAQGDKLIVGINSDESVRGLKGKGRPIQTQEERAMMLAALDIVDLVVIFDGDDPRSLIEYIQPSVLVKGSDYEREEIIGREFAKRTHIVERIEDGPSTTQTIERVKAHAAH